jgi:hypothetical protein
MRDRIRKWLGIDELPTKSNLAGHEAAARRRHEAVMAQLLALGIGQDATLKATAERIAELQIHVQGRADGLLTKLNEINSRLTATVQKANHPANFQAPELSWETVQQIALLDLEKEQEPA